MKIKFDKVLKCVEIEKYYDSVLMAKQACCFEPVPIFKDKEDPKITYSLPMRIRFKPGKKYRIRVEEM